MNESNQNPCALLAEQCGVLDKLEQLQFVRNQKVYEKAVEILETYFATEQQEDLMDLLQ